MTNESEVVSYREVPHSHVDRYTGQTLTPRPDMIFRAEIFPVMIVDDKIQMNEYLMDERRPYAFLYHGRTYIATRTNKRLRLDEIK